MPEPEFEDKWGGLAVVFKKKAIVKSSEKGSEKSSQKGSQKGSQKSSQKIIDLIANNPNITTLEMAEIIGISRRAVAKQINKLKDTNKPFHLAN